WGRVDKTWAHRVHPNTAVLQVRRPCPRKRTHSRLRGAINTPIRQSLLATMDAFRMIEAPSGISGSAFCTVKRTPFTLMLKIESSFAQFFPQPVCSTLLFLAALCLRHPARTGVHPKDFLDPVSDNRQRIVAQFPIPDGSER